MVRLNEVRPGELAVELPARADAEIYFVGRIRTPWTNRLECPRQGRPDGPTCRIEVFAPWDKGLDSIAEFERLEVLYWLHESRRDWRCNHPRATAMRAACSRCARRRGPIPSPLRSCTC
jgi:tRNA (Thr-GGU) A37 N-methylase